MTPMLPLDSTDVFMEECADMLRLVLDCPKSPKKTLLTLGSPHPPQYQLTSVSSNGSYNTVDIFRQSLYRTTSSPVTARCPQFRWHDDCT